VDARELSFDPAMRGCLPVSGRCAGQNCSRVGSGTRPTIRILARICRLAPGRHVANKYSYCRDSPFLRAEIPLDFTVRGGSWPGFCFGAPRGKARQNHVGRTGEAGRNWGWHRSCKNQFAAGDPGGLMAGRSWRNDSPIVSTGIASFCTTAPRLSPAWHPRKHEPIFGRS
jgi:hypothetical protein